MRHFVNWLLLAGFSWTTALAAQSLPLDAELAVFEPLLATPWRADLAQPGQRNKIDISLWQRALNGHAIKITHSVDNGSYGGETMLFYDKKQKSLVYYYFTTGGFYTHGTMQYDAKTGEFSALEAVENNADGITHVRSISRLRAGTLTVTSEYKKNGQWQQGHSAVYHPAPGLVPTFR